MRVLVTGGHGLLGSHIVQNLMVAKMDFCAPTRIQLDLRDHTKTLQFMREERISGVIHCAAKVGGIADNLNYPADYILENLGIDSSVLTAARTLKIEKLFYFASSCMYSPTAPQPFKENGILDGPLEPTNEGYAIAKLAGMKSVENVANQDSLAWRSFILSNLYGPRDNFSEKRSHLLAAIIKKAYAAKVAEKSSLDIWGDGTSRREFTYVQDVADFILCAWNKAYEIPLKMNLGFGIDYSVQEYYEAVCQILQFNPNFCFDLSKPDGMKKKIMDSSLARDYGWNPKNSLEKGLAKTIEWYSQNVSR